MVSDSLETLNISMSEFCRQNRILGRNRFMEILREHDILLKDGTPSQAMTEKKYMTLKLTPFIDSNGVKRMSRKTMITPAGVEWLLNWWKRQQAKVKNPGLFE